MVRPSAIPILFGTESGNSEYCADALARALTEQGIEAQSVDMEQFDLVRLEQEPVLVFISSTYGNGDPPYNATRLLEHLQTASLDLSHLRFAVCGLGDSTFEYFAKCGQDFEAALLSAGAVPMTERADCDVDFDDVFEAFRDRVVAFLADHPELRPTAQASAEPHTTTASPGRVFEAALVEKRRLSGPGSNKRTMHYVFDVSGAPQRYEVGDCFAVHPTNSPRVVDSVVEALGCSSATPVAWRGDTVPLSEVLSRACLQHVEAELVRQVAALPGNDERPAAAVCRDDAALEAYRTEQHVLDVLLDNSAHGLPPQALVSCLRKLQPRLYSVASASAANPERVAFTIETVRYQRGERVVEGVASSQLAEHVAEGDTVPMHLVPNLAFRFEPGESPVIMVGPGTGIAPFRGYLEHLQATQTRRPTWLFFGHQREGTDFLYREDVMAWLGSGVLERVSFAWSRAQAKKVYVQHKIVEHGAEVWAWLCQRASIYVCGDAAGMEPGVAQALRAVARDFGGVADPDAWFASLVEAGRYKTDVY